MAEGLLSTARRRWKGLMGDVESLSQGLGSGLASQVDSITGLIESPVETSRQMYQGVKALAQNPSVIPGLLRDAYQGATSGPMGFGEFVGANIGLRPKAGRRWHVSSADTNLTDEGLAATGALTAAESGLTPRVFHGTGEAYLDHDIAKSGSKFREAKGLIFYTDDPGEASRYAGGAAARPDPGGGRPTFDGANVRVARLRMGAPYTLDDLAADLGVSIEELTRGGSRLPADIYDTHRALIRERIKATGRDGVSFKAGGGRGLYAVVDASQVIPGFR